MHLKTRNPSTRSCYSRVMLQNIPAHLSVSEQVPRSLCVESRSTSAPPPPELLNPRPDGIPWLIAPNAHCLLRLHLPEPQPQTAKEKKLAETHRSGTSRSLRNVSLHCLTNGVLVLLPAVNTRCRIVSARGRVCLHRADGRAAS